MAIIKSLPSSYGVEASYHKITNISINYPVKELVICVCTYVSKETRIGGCDPIDSVDIEIPKEDFKMFENADVLEVAYKWLKVNVEGFENCQDDLEVCSALVKGDENDDSKGK